MAKADAIPSDVGSLVKLISDIDIGRFADEELARGVLDAERLLNAAHALASVMFKEFHRRGRWFEDGALSAPGWAAARTGSSPRSLRARLRVGAGLRLLPAAVPAARAGRLSPQHLDAMAGCARRHPDLATRDEAVLVEQAEALDADVFKLVARQWEEHAAAVAGTDPVEAAAAEPVDELHLSRTFDGRYQLNGSFSAETGQLLHAALDGEVDRALRARRDGDPSVAPVASRVRAATLVDLIAQSMRREPSDQSMPDRYRVAVVVNHDTSVEDLPLAACDSPAFRVVINAKSEVLDVGRLTQQWPGGIRRAITFRDRCCVFPGCIDHPHGATFIIANHGKTADRPASVNGALLCRRHHTFIHQYHWTITIEDHKPITRKPDGNPYLIGRWEAAASAA